MLLTVSSQLNARMSPEIAMVVTRLVLYIRLRMLAYMLLAA